MTGEVMTEFRADLHCHSTCSDGTETPEQLVTHAKEIGLSGLSITDHDCINAYHLALPVAQSLGIRLIPGVEFSSSFYGKSIHILGYNYSPESSAVQKLCEMHETRRKERNLEIVNKLRENDIIIDLEEVMEAGEHTIGRPHIAQAMVQKGYVKDINEAFKRWIGDGRPCYAKGSPVSTEETVSVIHEAGGAAVIAHPHLIKERATVKQLLTLPFDGIECYYARLLPHQEEEWVKLAQKYDLYITGGSDFHGSVKPETPLGASWVNEETFNKLVNHESS